MKKCPVCNREIPISKTYCSRECSAQGWKSLHSPILGKETRRRLEKRRLGK